MTYYTQQYQPPPGTQVQSQPLKEEFTRITQSFDAVETDINGKLSTAGGTVSGAVTIIGALTQSGNAVDFGAATSMRVPAPTLTDSLARLSDLTAALYQPGVIAWDNITGNANAVAGRGCSVRTNLGSFTITLPANPAEFTWIPFLDRDGNAAVNNIVINRNGQTIMGVAENMEINVNNAVCALQFVAGDWRLV